MTKYYPTQGEAKMNDNNELLIDPTGGSVASHEIDEGNPLKVGGVYSNPAIPDLNEGDRVDLQMDVNGNVKTVEKTNVAEHDTTSGGKKTTLATALDKTNDSITNYPVARNLSVISKTSAVTIGGGSASDTILVGLHISAALTGTCVITGFADSDGTAQTYTLPAATTAGWKDFGNVLNSAGALTVTCSNAGDDNLVTVIWRAA